MASDAIPSDSLAADLEIYNYAPLDKPNDEIRLAKLCLGEGVIECTLEVFSLADCPSFLALSYLWGPAAPVCDVRIGQTKSSIRQNLHLFLGEIIKAPDLKDRFFWMDQICINQNDTLEKNHQVKLMSFIYKSAESVLVWLGEPNDRRCEIFERFNKISSPSTPSSDWELETVEMLLEEYYCQRVWVKQEILLAKEAIVLITTEQRFSWNLIYDIIRARDESHCFDKRLKSAWGLAIGANWTYPSKHLDLCLMVFSTSECSDPRDKVYGILGLLTEALRPEVDYKKSVEQIFLDVVILSWRLAFEIGEEDYGVLSSTQTLITMLRSLGTELNTKFDLGSIDKLLGWIRQRRIEHPNEPITEIGFEDTGVLKRIFDRQGRPGYSHWRWWIKTDSGVHWHDEELG